MTLPRAPIVLISICALPAAHAAGKEDRRPPCAVKRLGVKRCPANPLITAETCETIGTNINGPSVVRAPDWLDEPLGRYYMYFAHHHGKHIRLACADKLAGPWTVRKPGTLKLGQASALIRGHVASPDVHVAAETQTVWMYFHGPGRRVRRQITGLATSKDGLHFAAGKQMIADFYFRRFRWEGTWYGVAKSGNQGGQLLRSDDPAARFEVRKKPLLPGMRHAAVLVRGDTLLVFYSRGGDRPERILLSTVKLTDDWTEWTASKPIDVLRPEKEYEGIEYKLRPSRWGSGTKVQELRDPCIFEEDGQVYLFYTIAGEMGIAMAELEIGIQEL
ncbi:MAG: hypothetical protein R6V58_07775 [Planctomycetota bacterium]